MIALCIIGVFYWAQDSNRSAGVKTTYKPQYKPPTHTPVVVKKEPVIVPPVVRPSVAEKIETAIENAKCVATIDVENNTIMTREEALMWYIDERTYSNPVSAAEQKVAAALDEFPVEYYREVSFLGMELPSGKHMRVDFWIPDLCIVIEYDGEGWHNTPEQLARDRMKDEFCERWGLTMIRLSKKHYYCMDYTISGILSKYGIKRK